MGRLSGTDRAKILVQKSRRPTVEGNNNKIRFHCSFRCPKEEKAILSKNFGALVTLLGCKNEEELGKKCLVSIHKSEIVLGSYIKLTRKRFRSLNSAEKVSSSRHSEEGAHPPRDMSRHRKLT
jgi:hypothetical protein